MRELVDTITAWRNEGQTVALATVVKTWGSAPRPLGAAMIVSSRGDIAGSVSGGCVEGAVAAEAERVLDSGDPRLVSYGVSNETAWSVGLSCGGRIDVFIERIPGRLPGEERHRKVFDLLVRRLLADQTSVRAISVGGPLRGSQMLLGVDEILAGSLGSRKLDSAVHSFVREESSGLLSEYRSFEIDGDRHDVFLDLFLPRPNLIIIGAVHVAVHLVSLAHRLGYSTTVVDPRTAFATPERFAEADSLLSQWPEEALPDLPIHESTCFVFLSHDLKIDLPGLEIALRSPALYIGALGSSRTHKKRVEALRDRGVPDEAIGRIFAPIGLDLGGRRAEEIALSIMAEIVAVRYGKA